jgi:hypothetical protein
MAVEILGRCVVKCHGVKIRTHGEEWDHLTDLGVDDWLTESMKFSRYSEADSFSANQEVLIVLRNPKVYHRVCSYLLLSVPELSSPFLPPPPPPSCLIRYIWIFLCHLCLGLSRCSFPSGFPTQTLYVFSFAYGKYLQVDWITSRREPTRGGLPAWQLGERVTVCRKKN